MCVLCEDGIMGTIYAQMALWVDCMEIAVPHTWVPSKPLIATLEYTVM